MLTRATLFSSILYPAKENKAGLCGNPQHPCLAYTTYIRGAGPVQLAEADSVEIRLKLEITQPIPKTTRIHEC